MRKMNAEERKRFLLGRARTAVLATVRPDGRPHVAPIWFDLDGETVVFTTWHSSVKARNIANDPRVSLCVDDERPPFAFVVMEGEAVVREEDPDLLYWASRIAGRYMGRDQAESYGKRNGVEGELLVRVRPTRIVARRNAAD
ncbi:PPOX class F420-dependent oxidoreductase [soil metagenome]